MWHIEGTMYYVVVLVTVTLFLLYYYLTKTYGYWKRKSIPCLEGAFPGLGNVYPMLFLRKNMAEMYQDFYKQTPGLSMVGFYNLREPNLMIRDPELVRTVMLKNFPNFAVNGLAIDKELDPLLAVNPFFADEERWKASRQQLSSAFTSGKLKYMFTSVNEVCSKLDGYLNELVKSGNGKAELELKDLFSKFTAEVVASAAFGVDGGSFESDKDGPFREMGRLMFEPSFFGGLNQIILLLIPSLSRILRISFMPAKADQFFRKVVKDMLKYREEKNVQRPDFLQLMIQYKNEGAMEHTFGQVFNDDVITSHAASFFGDGYETSSVTLSFLVYQLAAHPKVQDRLREEVVKVIAKHGGLGYEALQEMTYMDQTLNESMRIFPAFGALLKICTQEIKLVGSDGITFEATPGTPIVIPTSALQRDPEYWPDPEKFDPERFSEENKFPQHRFTFLPFGEGPRACPGMRMAMMQIKAAVATVIQSYTFEVSPRTKVPIKLDPHYFLSVVVGGLWVNVRRL